MNSPVRRAIVADRLRLWIGLKPLNSRLIATAQSLNNLGSLYIAQDNYAAAEPLYQRALKIRERALGPDHPDTATSLNNLAELYRAEGKQVEAELLFQRVQKIKEKSPEAEE